MPAILIGHTRHLAWTHTVSTAFRFVPVELDLVPDDPTSYMVDGQPERMEADTITVQTLQPDGSLAPVTHTLYTTRYGPDFNALQGAPFFAWTPTTAFAMFDSNAENMRGLNHFFDTDRAIDQGAARDPAQVPGHSLGEHDVRRLEGPRALRRYRLDAERPG